MKILYSSLVLGVISSCYASDSYDSSDESESVFQKARALGGKSKGHKIKEIKDPITSNKKSQIYRKSEVYPGQAHLEIGDLYMKKVREGREEYANSAMEYYETAAELGNKYAYMRLGSIYHYGQYGVTQDYEFAQKLYLKAHKLGHDKAWDAYLRALSDETNRQLYPWLYK